MMVTVVEMGGSGGGLADGEDGEEEGLEEMVSFIVCVWLWLCMCVCVLVCACACAHRW